MHSVLLLLLRQLRTNTNQPLHLLHHHRAPIVLHLLLIGNQRLALLLTTSTGKLMMPQAATTMDRMRREMGTGPQGLTMSPFLMAVSRRLLTLLMDLVVTGLMSPMKALLSFQLSQHVLMEQLLQLHLLPTGQASKPILLTISVIVIVLFC